MKNATVTIYDKRENLLFGSIDCDGVNVELKAGYIQLSSCINELNEEHPVIVFPIHQDVVKICVEDRSEYIPKPDTLGNATFYKKFNNITVPEVYDEVVEILCNKDFILVKYLIPDDPASVNTDKRFVQYTLYPKDIIDQFLCSDYPKDMTDQSLCSDSQIVRIVE